MMINLALAIFSCMFLLSDFYFYWLGRPFDYIAISAFFVLALSNATFFKNLIKANSKFKLLIAIVAPWVIFGALFNDSFLAAISIAVGVSIVLPGTYALGGQLGRSVIHSQFNTCIKVSMSLFLVQFFIYYLYGFFIDVPGSFGAIESRGLNEGLDYFRPSGLFQEPNAYCAAMFCMLSISAFMEKRNYAIEILGIFSMILSQSLWGFGAVLTLIYLLYGFKWLLIIISTFSLLATAIFSGLGISLDSLSDTSVTLSRILNIENDPSRQDRFGSVENFNFDMLLFTGRGIDTSNFQSFAANGFAFLLYSFGIIGSLLLFLCFAYLVRFNIKALIASVFLLSTFPYLSYMFFWSWIGILIFLIKPHDSFDIMNYKLSICDECN